LARGLKLPPRGSATAVILENMVHRERMRSWNYHVSSVLTLAAQITGDRKLIDKLATHLDKLYNMELHQFGAYDSSVAEDKPTSAKEKSVDEMMALLDRLPNV